MSFGIVVSQLISLFEIRLWQEIMFAIKWWDLLVVFWVRTCIVSIFFKSRFHFYYQLYFLMVTTENKYSPPILRYCIWHLFKNQGPDSWMFLKLGLSTEVTEIEPGSNLFSKLSQIFFSNVKLRIIYRKKSIYTVPR